MYLERIYKRRFDDYEVLRNRIWKVLVKEFFQPLMPNGPFRVLDLGCGYGQFINNISAGQRFAVDLNPGVGGRLEKTVQFFQIEAQKIQHEPALTELDAIFTSNFFEHLPNKDLLLKVVSAAHSSLKPGGVLVAMGPNIRYLPGRYWDFIDHHIPLTERSLSELLESQGFVIRKSIPRFLPYTMSNKRPPPAFFVRLYLLCPLVWIFLGKQFLIVAEKPKGRD